MASGDGSDETISADGSPGPAPEPVDAAARNPAADPVVEIGWLDRRTRPRGTRRPRWSTLLLITAFLAVLILYLLLQPG
ncbi:hypothetical protein [Nocardia carnea]|uniref:hypothetical protein n=1 Tax=Nocardia carnea TaxID=37328 RepID=UPI002457F9B3|nr:hypothetical protein [Nocardia carnea]